MSECNFNCGCVVNLEVIISILQIKIEYCIHFIEVYGNSIRNCTMMIHNLHSVAYNLCLTIFVITVANNMCTRRIGPSDLRRE